MLDRLDCQSNRFLCNVLAVLIYSKCTRKDMLKFDDIYINRPRDRPITEELPIRQDLSRWLFGVNLGDKFYHDQLIFTPYVFHEGQENNPKDPSTGLQLRLPIIEESIQEIGNGQYSVVFCVEFESGGWKDLHGVPNGRARMESSESLQG
jgi:hypothetical protein